MEVDNMELRNVKTFLCAANTESFSKAAEMLGYTQSTITTQIQQLESELGVQLFDRYGKRIGLSNAGHAFLPYAYELVKCEASAISCFSEEATPSGALKIGMIESVSYSNYSRTVLDYIQKYRSVNIKVTIATTLEILDLLKSGKLDMILTLDSKIVEPGLITHYVKEENIVFLCSSKSSLPKRGDTRLVDLKDECWVMAESGRNYIRELEKAMAERGISPWCALEVGSTSMLINAVRSGIGITLRPEFCLNNSEDICILPLDYTLTMYFQVLTNKNRWLSPAIRSFLNIFQ